MIVREGYMSGGAGYVLSRGETTVFNNVVRYYFLPSPESLRRLATEGLTNSSKCKVENDEGAEDVEMGLCLQNVGVLSADSRDNMGKFRWAAGRGGGVSVNQ